MRHAVFGKKLSRDTKARKALRNNLANSLIIHGQLKTTLAKAKVARSFIEKLVTLAKKNRLSHNRHLASKLNHDAFLKLVNEIAPGFIQRKGGYTRIVKLNSRRGDSAPLARLELLEWTKPKEKSAQSKVQKKSKKTIKSSAQGKMSKRNKTKSLTKKQK